MATKKSSQTAKTKTKKSPVAKKSTVKTPAKTEPHHFSFGCLMIAIGFVLFLALTLCFAVKYAKEELSADARNFAAEYTSVPEDNLFKIKSGKEVIDILENGTGVVFLGFPSCPWCQAYAPMLNSLAKEYGISEIYYHNTYDDWKNDTDEYKKITELLSDYLQYDNVGEKHLYVPNAAFVVDGKIVGNDWETSKDTLDAETPEEYWTEERVDAWKEKVGKLLEEVKKAE